MYCLKNRVCAFFFYFTLALWLSSALSGCSNVSVSSHSMDDTCSLRSSLLNLTDSTRWTAASENSSENDIQEDFSVRLPSPGSQNAETLFATLLSLEKPIYPFLEGFAVLDTSVLPLPVRSLLDDVLKGCQAGKFDVNLFSSDVSFLKIIIEYELQLLPPIDSWLVGYANILDSNTYEIPVRFFTAQGFFDSYIYIGEEGEGIHKIEQLFFKETEE